MTDEQKIQALKDLAIFLARCYQKNYEVFADVHCFQTYVKENLTPQQYEVVLAIHNKFHMVQGFQQQNFINDISTLDKGFPLGIAQYREIFGVPSNSIHHVIPNAEACLKSAREFFNE